VKLKKDILATYRKRAINAHLLSKLRMIGVVMKVWTGFLPDTLLISLIIN